MKRLTQKKMFSFYKSGKEKTCLDITEYTQIRDFKTDPGDERFYLVGEVVEKLAAYEDADEKGLLIRLPIAEGSAAYVIDHKYECKHDYECQAFEQYKCGSGIVCEHEFKVYKIKEVKFELGLLPYIGEFVFVTKEEAEQALKKIQEEA